MNTRLSTSQQAILTALAAGAVLRYRIYCCEWRWLLNGGPADGRSVGGLIDRGLVQYIRPSAAGPNELVLADAGRAWLARRNGGRP